MKKIILILLISLASVGVNAQDCAGMITGMNLNVLSTSTIELVFYRPLMEKKYWRDSNTPQYESDFLVTCKPYFTHTDSAKFFEMVDTTTKQLAHQETSDNHISVKEITGLYPATNYEICVYTRCQDKLVGPMCYYAPTTKVSPCSITMDSISGTSCTFKFKYKPNTSVLPEKVYFEYRESSQDWKVKESYSMSSIYIDDLIPNKTYFARVRFKYANYVTSDYSDILIFLN